MHHRTSKAGRALIKRKQVNSNVTNALAWKPLEDLAVLYSPNHSDTTAQHVRKQIEMVKSLAFQDYSSLLKLTGSHAVEPIRVSEKELENFFTPLIEEFTSNDYKLLVSLAAVHDCGKEALLNSELSRIQSSAEVPMSDHITASELLLRSNPQLLDHFDLSDTDAELVKLLTGKHTDTGRYFFGEAHLATFDSVMELAREQGSRKPLEYSLAHGALDVMSVSKGTFCKPIASSHIKLREVLFDAYESGQDLWAHFNDLASTELLDAEVSNTSLGVPALWRLYKMVGSNKDASFQDTLEIALEEIDQELVSKFDKIMGNRHGTLLGSYLPMAFGSGLYTALVESGDDPTTARKNAITSTVKMIAIAGHYAENELDLENDISLSAREVSLAISKKSAPENYAVNATLLIDSIAQIPNTLNAGVEYLASKENKLSIGEQGGAVELFYTS